MWGNLTNMREFFKKIDLATLAGAEGKIALAPEFLEFAPLRAPVQSTGARSASRSKKIGANSAPLRSALRSALRSVQTLCETTFVKQPYSVVHKNRFVLQFD